SDCAGSAGSASGGGANAWVMPVWGGRPRPPTCALQFVIRPNGTAEKPALIRTSAFDLEVHCGADNEAAQKGAEYYSPGRKSWVSLRTSESRRNGRNETGHRAWEGHGFTRAATVLQSCHSEPSVAALYAARTSEESAFWSAGSR